MKEDDLFVINVSIAENIFPMRILRKDEERIRKAAKLVNDKFKVYQRKYSNVDNAKLLSMLALEITSEYFKVQSLTDMDPFVEKVQDIEKRLEDYLKIE
mgnify:FL=1|jgi:cell division protein ZapA